MAKEFNPKIVSANDLLDGDVVYLEKDGSWTRRLSEASVAESEEAAESLLALGDQPDKVVGPYLVDVALDDGREAVLMHFRERFRDLGPTNRPDLGRQADPDHRQDRSPSQGAA